LSLPLIFEQNAQIVKSSENFQVLIPSGIAAVIEIWKVTVAFKIRIDFGSSFFSIPRIKFSTDISASEKETKQVRDMIVISNKWVVQTLDITVAFYFSIDLRAYAAPLVPNLNAT
jgi:hypothetical protein